MAESHHAKSEVEKFSTLEMRDKGRDEEIRRTRDTAANPTLGTGRTHAVLAQNVGGWRYAPTLPRSEMHRNGAPRLVRGVADILERTLGAQRFARGAELASVVDDLVWE